MFKFSLTILLLATVIWSQEINPSYKYRYQKEDLMKTAESEIPMRGYHVTEGEYYPAQSVGGIGIGGGYGGGQFIGGGGGGGRFIGGGGGQYLGGGGGRFIGSGGQFIGGGGGQFIGGGGGGGFIGKPFIGGSGQFIGGGLGGGGGQFIGGGGYGGGGFVGGGYSPYYHHGSGGQVLDKQEFSGGSKKLNDEGYQKLNGAKGEEFSDGQEGYNKGQVAVKNSKGDSGYYNEAEAGKKAVGDEKTYHGNQHFDEQGKAGGEKKNNEYHKKGHVIKGFKSSHHKDEDGKTEEFYDEEHNSGDNYNYDGQTGSFGKNAGGSYKGGHDNGQFNAVENKKQGQYDNHHIVDNSNAGQGQYGQKKYGGSGESFGSQNGVDQHSLLGHQEANKIYKHHPYHVPIFQY